MQEVMDPTLVGKWHLLAYNMTHSVGAGYEQLVAAVDPVFTRSNSNYQNPYNLACFGAYAESTNLIRARINTASLRLRGFPVIRPMVNATQPPANPNWMDMRNFPIYLRPDEDIEVDGDPGANADIITAFLWVKYLGSSYPEPMVSNVNAKDLRWVRATVTFTSVLNAWSGPQAITFDDVLEGGSYDVYGCEVAGPNVQAFRIWFQNQYWKPGFLGFAAVGSRQPYPLYESPFGLWGNFNTYSLPMIETFESAAASTAKTIHLLIGKSSERFRGQQT